MTRNLDALRDLNDIYWRMSLVIYKGLLTKCGVRHRIRKT